MKILVCLFLTSLIGFITYRFFAKKSTSKKHSSSKRKAIIVATIVVLFLTLCTFLIAYLSSFTPDRYCLEIHATNSQLPKTLITAQDFFDLGNYLYDMGNCKSAVTAYEKAIQLDPNLTKAYNNRAYTNMRLHNYKDALDDLNVAIFQDPDYIAARMNRGDIYNYYYAIDRQKAIADYNKVIALGKDKDLSNSVCGHKAMAQTNNMIPLAFLKIFTDTSCH